MTGSILSGHNRKPRVLGVVPVPTDGVADRLRKLMRDRGLSQVELAEQLCVTAAYVSRLLSGTRSWTLNLVIRCAAILEVSPLELAPTAAADLKQALFDLEVRGDQVPAVAAFIACLPRIRHQRHVEALVTTLEAMAEINSRPPSGRGAAEAGLARFVPLAQGAARVVQDPECA